jgi:hypothetical protein
VIIPLQPWDKPDKSILIADMNANYTIYPDAGYILETYCGAVTFTQCEHFVLRQRRDMLLLPHYHTVSDFTQAAMRLSIAEVEQLVHLMCDPLLFRSGNRALVIDGLRNIAFADVFRNYLEQEDILSQCFSNCDAAIRWATLATPQTQIRTPEFIEVFG